VVGVDRGGETWAASLMIVVNELLTLVGNLGEANLLGRRGLARCFVMQRWVKSEYVFGELATPRAARSTRAPPSPSRSFGGKTGA
jgi:hypothetical protein